MLVTRPEPEALHTLARLHALDIPALSAPMLQFRTLDTSLPGPEGFAALALTSGNALRALEKRGVLRRYLELPVFAVGDATAALARSAGFGHVESARGGLRNLSEHLANAKLTGPVLYPAARETAGDLARALAPFGIMVVTARVYDMVPVETMEPEVFGQLRDGTVDAALFYSKRTAQNFVRCVAERLDTHERRRITMLCLSEAVAEPLIEAHFVRIGLADHPSEEAMMSLALGFARERA